MTFIINSKKFGSHEVTIDDEDASRVLCHTWHVHYCYRKNRPVLKGVRTDIIKNGKKKKLLLHKLLKSGLIIDHIDNDVLNNRKNNLRSCSNSENAMNTGKRKSNTSGFKGVSWHKRYNKYTAQIAVDRNKIHLGYFDLKEDAAEAYNKAAIKYHGKFARLNEI